MEDPLQDYSGLSLFPRKLALPPGALKSTDSDESTHDFMKSMELRSPHKYLEQAKSTVDSNRELLNLEFDSLLATNNEHEDGAANRKEILRGRRPGLGRKKAQFTMIPKLSQPPMSSEPLRDVELSRDPKEFFAYFERREMAEKELRRLKGANVGNVIDLGLPRPERRRRPGLLGRTATYKHFYPSSTLPQNNDTLISSQGIVEKGLLSPVNHTSQPEADSRVESEKKLTESESKISTLFDELLGLKDLDKDGISSLVLERLQIKPTIIDEIPIPVFQGSRINSKSRTALSDIQNLGQMVRGKASAKDKHVAKSPFQSLASSRPSISPLASISAFQKHIQQSNMSNDRFSALDLSPPRKSSLGDVDEQSNNLDTRKEFIASGSSELNSMLPEVDDSAVDELVSSEMIADRNDIQYDKSVKDRFSRPEVSNMTARSTDADSGGDVDAFSCFHDKMLVDDVGEEPLPSGQVDANMESSSRIHTVLQTVGTDESDENVGIMSQDVEPFINELTVDRMKSKGHMTDHVNPAAGEPSYIADVILVQHSQNTQGPSEVHLNDRNTAENPSESSSKRKVHIQSHAEVPWNDQSKAEVPPRKGPKGKAKEPLEVPLNDLSKALPPQKSHKRKAFSRRHSLAAAGTHWEEGKRKSSRIKMRPLEYWKGERFLYGRVHESLATVIGLKYSSPEKDAEDRFGETRNMKIKSYVSGEYEELVKHVSFY